MTEKPSNHFRPPPALPLLLHAIIPERSVTWPYQSSRTHGVKDLWCIQAGHLLRRPPPSTLTRRLRETAAGCPPLYHLPFGLVTAGHPLHSTNTIPPHSPPVPHYLPQKPATSPSDPSTCSTVPLRPQLSIVSITPASHPLHRIFRLIHLFLTSSRPGDSRPAHQIPSYLSPLHPPYSPLSIWPDSSHPAHHPARLQCFCLFLFLFVLFWPTCSVFSYC